MRSIFLLFIVLLACSQRNGLVNPEASHYDKWSGERLPASISLSDFLILSHNGYQGENSIYNYNDSTLHDFYINTARDTIFIKSEGVRISSVEISNLLAAWGKDRFSYASEALLFKKIKSDTLKSFILNTHSEFLDLVQSWDTTQLRSIERSFRNSAHTNSVLYRIIFNNGHYKTDKFNFKDLRLPHLEKDGSENHDVTYTVLIDN